MDILSVPPFTTRAFTWQEHAGPWNLTILCKLTYTLAPGAALVATEPEGINDRDNHWDDDPQKSLYAPSDLVPYKPKPEVLLVGSAYAPRGEPVRSLFVRLVVANLDKSIEVFGPRTFDRDGRVVDGPRWTQMPLRYERAAGGEGSWNCVGIDPAAADAYGRRTLPNLEPPGTLDAERGGEIAAVGFGPIAARWPMRRDKLGANPIDFADERWTEVPLGADLDGSYFQSAPLDQQVEELRPDEPIVLEHMHPEHERLATRLPGVFPRARVEIEGMPPWELGLVADTLWIDTNRGICTLTWRGQLPLDGRDQPGAILIGSERPGEPVRYPDPPRRPSPPLLASTPPPGDDDNDNELTQTTDEALRVTGAHVLPSVPALPFAPSTGAPPPVPRSAPKPRPARPVDDPDETVLMHAPKVRGRMPTWLGGASVEAPPVATQATDNAPRIAPPIAPPPPVTQLLRGAFHAPSQTPSVGLPGVVAPPSTALPPAPPPSRSPMPPPVGTTLGQVAVLEASKHRPAAPLSSAPAPVPHTHEKAPARAGKPDPRTLATAAFLGAAEASNAAATLLVKESHDKPERGGAPAQAAAQAPGRMLVDFLWFSPELSPRLEENETWKRILAPDKPEEEAEPEPEVFAPDPENPDALPPPPRKKRKRPPEKEKTPEERSKEEKLRVSKVLMRTAPTLDAEAALFGALNDDGMLEPPLCVVAGELELPFDEVETLKVLTSAATPLAMGDKKLKETLDLANEALGTPLGSSPEVAANFAMRVRDAWNKANRMLPPDYLDVHSRRVLLEQRKYQLRELVGASWIRALLHGSSGERPVPTYLPAELLKKLPLFMKFSVRMIVELLPQQDQNEAHAVAMRVLALARTVAPRRR